MLFENNQRQKQSLQADSFQSIKYTSNSSLSQVKSFSQVYQTCKEIISQQLYQQTIYKTNHLQKQENLQPNQKQTTFYVKGQYKFQQGEESIKESSQSQSNQNQYLSESSIQVDEDSSFSAAVQIMQNSSSQFIQQKKKSKRKNTKLKKRKKQKKQIQPQQIKKDKKRKKIQKQKKKIIKNVKIQQDQIKDKAKKNKKRKQSSKLRTVDYSLYNAISEYFN